MLVEKRLIRGYRRYRFLLHQTPKDKQVEKKTVVQYINNHMTGVRTSKKMQALVFKMWHSTTHHITHYPLDSAMLFPNTH